MTSGSCSTTTTVLPQSRSASTTFINRSVSRGCSPTVGSSSTYSVWVSAPPSAVAKLIRWASPPERVRVCRAKVR
ncbi:MAG: hypothetical protein BWZ10_02568 [candidate division BRC1 bacterium ADurb.BinA364]|nr:MAG: hypothetical protein BWZ10_02568 [candidate division BRC1 bacterium ADurb.BinA364]